MANPAIGRVALRLALTASILIPMTGCESWVLRPDAEDMAGSVGPIYMDQIYDNLATFFKQPDSIPSEIAVNTGTIMVNSYVNPSITVPFGNQVVRGAADTVTAVTTQYRSLTLGGELQRQGTWNVFAVTDPTQLENVAALYRYATTGQAGDLIKDYRLPLKYSANGVFVDPAYFASPFCVFCVSQVQAKELGSADMTQIQEDQVKDLHYINPLLLINSNSPWLLGSDHDTPPPHPAPSVQACQPPSQDVSERKCQPKLLGRYKGYYLWLTPDGEAQHSLSTFVAFVLAQTVPSTSSASSQA